LPPKFEAALLQRHNPHNVTQSTKSNAAQILISYWTIKRVAYSTALFLILRVSGTTTNRVQVASLGPTPALSRTDQTGEVRASQAFERQSPRRDIKGSTDLQPVFFCSGIPRTLENLYYFYHLPYPIEAMPDSA
jgi:hypothetical protein